MANQGIIVDLEIKTPKAVKAMQDMQNRSGKLEKKIDKLTGAVNAQANAVSRLARGYGQVASNAQRAANATKRVRAPGRFSSFGITDPDSTIKRYGAAASQGDGAAQRWVLAAQAAKNRQRRVNNIVNPPDPFMQAMMRTRFAKGIMGRVGMPLGVDIAKFAGDPDKMNALFGKGAQNMGKFVAVAGKAGPIIGAALVVVGSAVIAAKQALANARAERITNVRLGGSATQSKAAAIIGAMTGTDASSVMANVGGGGLAGAVAMKYGVSPVRGYYGDINDSEAFAKIARGIGRLPYQQARREAIGLGSPDLANLALLNESTRERLISARASQNSPANMKASAEFAANMEIAKASFQKLINVLGGPSMRGAVRAFSSIVDGISHTADIADRIFGRMENGFEMMDRLFGGEERKVKAEKKFSESVDKFDRAVDGMSGGGPRAGGAVPDAYRNKPIDEDRRAEYQRKLRMGMH